MKLKSEWITYDTNGEQILVATNGFSGIVRNNHTAMFIVNCLKKEVTEQEIIEAILNQYDVSRNIAEKDVKKFLEQLRNIGALDES